MRKSRPKVGLALSGAANRALAHVGVLEVFQENNIPIDYMTVCSSATMVGVSYASGKMQELKNDWMKLNKKFVLSKIRLSPKSAGLFSVEEFVKWYLKYADHKKLEEYQPKIGIVCADIKSGEAVNFQMGDPLRAGLASCAVPGLIEPVEWGDRLLVDGALLSIVPAKEAYEMGADVVIAVDIAAIDFMFGGKYAKAWTASKKFTKTPMQGPLQNFRKRFEQVYQKSVQSVLPYHGDWIDKKKTKEEDIFSVLRRSLDIAAENLKTFKPAECDLVIKPDVKHFGKVNFNDLQKIYTEGRRAAKAAIPEVKQIIGEHDK